MGKFLKAFVFNTVCDVDGNAVLVYTKTRVRVSTYSYAPLGRFLSRDPIAEQGGRNLYTFVKNAPILKWDKLGRAIPQLGAGPDGGFPIYCRDRIAEFMEWFELEKAKLEDRDEDGRNWIEKLPKCPGALRKIMSLFRTTLPSGCTYYEERLTFVSPDLSEWTLTSDIVFEATQILGLLSCGMRYHPTGSYELRTRDTSKCDGHGNQCIYDNEGNLIREIPTAGTVDWVGPGDRKLNIATQMYFSSRTQSALIRRVAGTGNTFDCIMKFVRAGRKREA